MQWTKRKIVIGVAGLALLCLAVWAFAQARDAVASQAHERAEQALSRFVPAFELGPDVGVSWRGQVTLGPVVLRLRAGDDAPVVRIARIVITPALGSLFSGHAQVAHVHIDDLAADLGASLDTVEDAIADYVAFRAQAAAASPLADSSQSRPPMTASLNHVRVRLPLPAGWEHPADADVELATVMAHFACAADGCKGSMAATFANGGDIELELTRTAGAIVVDSHASAIATANVPEAVMRRLPLRVTDGRGDASLHATIAFADGIAREIDAEAAATLRNLTLDEAKLADGAVTFGQIDAAAHLAYRAADGRVVLDRAYVGLAGDEHLRVHIDGITDVAPPYAMTVQARASDVPCDALFAAMPKALAPDDDDPRPRGTLEAWALLSGPALHLERWQLSGDVDTKAARGEALTGAETLRGAFTHVVVDDHGVEHSIVVGPTSAAYVPIAGLPAHVVRAVTTAEDGGFFGHHGFDFAEIQNSIAADVSAGRSVRGASTLTQQLAKNLFLSSEKTYSRKVREAFITLALESTVGKQRMLEIYLNVIEWGPGIYGIGPAAQRYFGKHPTELTAKEAAFLASIIPNPVRYYGYYVRGELTDTWNQRVNDILDKLHTTGVLDDESHALAVNAPVIFSTF